MLKRERWRCGCFAGKGTPETQAGQRGCVTARCWTGPVSIITKSSINNEHNYTVYM